ncbi:MAG: hypothetical protein H7330_01185 [Hymenobacteraceae bacterium]|nr:hypothetical protein [Hymenobacteraceae bacterium]
MSKTIWLSYDLGLRGDYTNLYAWLDAHGARECGDSVAVFDYKIGGDVIQWLKQELAEHVKFSPKDRVYAVFREGEKMRGKFIKGGRKRAPWEGYSGHDTEEDSEDEGQ